MKVLVVEDDPFIREMAVAGLEDAGYEVIETGNGGDALRLLQAGIILDALLTDIRLPGANGWAAEWLGRGPGLLRALSRSACAVCDRLRGAGAAGPGRDHHLQALQAGSGDWHPGNMGGLRHNPFWNSERASEL
jgi:CheY-like chemotaxis protein